MTTVPIPSSEIPDPATGRAWSSPGLLRRVEARREARSPHRPHRPTLWSRLHRRPWSAEGTVMVLVAAVCLLLTALAVSAAQGGPGLVSSGAAGCTIPAGRGSASPCLPGAR
ncbi:MAG TPA: hypothetical protein VGL20_09710 [Candidatus Dormibacteraeota bacterium]|jgi:hypothetical protein